jgi:Glu-tRNA(Gln) amidotransferase subunit E-like FAD-binding protein
MTKKTNEVKTEPTVALEYQLNDIDKNAIGLHNIDRVQYKKVMQYIETNNLQDRLYKTLLVLLIEKGLNTIILESDLKLYNNSNESIYNLISSFFNSQRFQN